MPARQPCAVARCCTDGPDDQWFKVVSVTTAVELHFCPRHALCAEMLVMVLGHLASAVPALIRLAEPQPAKKL